MPRRPLKPCAQPGCPALVESGRCPDHDRKRQYNRDHPRGSSTAQGYGQRWRRARARFLGAHPLCAQCQREGRVTAATVVDHKVPHRADAALFWDESNWQPLCGRCHDRKTARQGRWGRPVDIFRLDGARER